MERTLEFNIADLFESVVDAVPNRTALVSGSTRLSFRGLDERANRVASFLASRGVGTGDHVGLHLYNGAPFVEAMLGVFKLRAVPINLNFRYVADELRYLCDNADLVAVLSQRAFAGVLADATRGLPALRTAILVSDADDGDATIPDGFEAFDYAAVQAAGSPERAFEQRSGDDLYIIYTGGTTGLPKGVVWRHRDVFFAGLQGGRPGDDPIERPEQLAEHVADPDNAICMLPAAPFIHGAAQWAALIGLFSGGRLVLQPGKSVDARRIAQLIQDEGVNTITLVGDAMALPLTDALAEGNYDCSSLFAIASAGAVLSPSVRDRLRELLPDTLVLNNFGSTESGHQGSAFPGGETGTEGRPSFSMGEHTAVLDDNLQPIAAGSDVIGKIARRGYIPLGYYKDPVKTAERFIEVDGVRWCLPGDFATVEADGRVTLLGRGSSCINTGGEKVFPEEVEEALKSHPGVYDALVVGVPDPRWMQRVAAVVQPRAGAAPNAEELQAHCRTRIAGFKVPRQIELVPEVARMPSGKPDYAWAKMTILAAESS